MNKNGKTRILGTAFIIQFITSFANGVFIKPLWFVKDDMQATLLRIADNLLLMRFSILLDMLTALGVIFLGAVLYNTLRKENRNLALTALAFYILEGALLAASKMEAFTILQISSEYAASGFSPELLLMSQISYNSMEFAGSALHMLVFCFGAVMFYYLLFRTAKVPKWLSVWGLAALSPLFVGTIVQILGHSLPFFLYIPYVPFELVIGIYILARGINQNK